MSADVTSPPELPDEHARLAALHRLALHTKPPGDRFDRITRLAGRVLDMPIALVNLIDRDHQWSLACVGLPGDDVPRAQSFCAHAIASDDPLVVPDLARDARFRDNLFVTGDAALRFYAGQPIAGPGGHRLGTLCVADLRPRTLGDRELESLRDLARLVERELSADALNEALEARAVAERRTRAIMDSAAEGIFTTDREGRVEYLNPAAGRALGLLTDEAVGRPLVSLLARAGVRAQRGDVTLASLLEAGRRGTASATVSRFDTGADLPIEYTAGPIGQDQGWVVTFRDVTARVELERLRERFVSTASHELRTPLAAIIGYVDVLAAELSGPLNEDQRAQLATVGRSAERLRGLIDDLLALAESGTPASALTLAAVDLGQLARDVAAELGPVAAARDVRVTVDAADPAVEADDRRLRRVLVNVLGNAIKFSPAGSEVAVRAHGTQDGAVVEVTDSGPGIPEDELPLVGTRFFRASTADGVPGTGLGASIAREIAEQHGGTLEFTSAPGQGTCVRLRLPHRPPTA